MTKRVVSAIVMVLIFVPFLIMGGIPFTILMAVLGVLGLYELLKIRGDVKKKFPIVMRLLAYIMVIFLIVNNANSIDLQYDLDYRLVSLIIFLFLAPMVFINNSKKYNLNDALFLVGSVVFIGLSFNLLTVIRNFNIAYIIYLFLITTMTDTFALFTGMLIGKHKLAPEISPKKTIEGAVGGYACCMVDYEVAIVIRQITSGIANGLILVSILSLIGGDGIGSGLALVGQALVDAPSIWMFFIGGVFASFSFKFWYKGASMCGAALGMGCNGTYAFWGPVWCLVVCGLIFGVDGYAIPWQGWVGAAIMVAGIVTLAISQDKASKEA